MSGAEEVLVPGECVWWRSRQEEIGVHRDCWEPGTQLTRLGGSLAFLGLGNRSEREGPKQADGV